MTTSLLLRAGGWDDANNCCVRPINEGWMATLPSGVKAMLHTYPSMGYTITSWDILRSNTRSVLIDRNYEHWQIRVEGSHEQSPFKSPGGI